jgi:hypothetical protein
MYFLDVALGVGVDTILTTEKTVFVRGHTDPAGCAVYLFGQCILGIAGTLNGIYARLMQWCMDEKPDPTKP